MLNVSNKQRKNNKTQWGAKKEAKLLDTLSVDFVWWVGSCVSWSNAEIEHQNRNGEWEREKKTEENGNMLCCIYTLCWKLSQLKCRWFFSSSSDEKSFSLFLIVFSKHITYVSLAAINVCILWTGPFFLYLSSVYPFTIIAMVWLENGCFGLQIEVFKSSMHKNICP